MITSFHSQRQIPVKPPGIELDRAPGRWRDLPGVTIILKARFRRVSGQA